MQHNGVSTCRCIISYTNDLYPKEILSKTTASMIFSRDRYNLSSLRFLTNGGIKTDEIFNT